MSNGLPIDVVIGTPDPRIRVFVSSMSQELAEERRSVSRAVSALRLTPVKFELGARPYPPQEVYRAYLAQLDIFIGLLGSRRTLKARRRRAYRCLDSTAGKSQLFGTTRKGRNLVLQLLPVRSSPRK